MSDFPTEEAAVPYDPESDQLDRADSRVERVRQDHETRLLAMEGVEGVGIGTGEIGDDVIVVYLCDAAYADSIPREIDGVPVKTEVTGIVDAL